MDYLKQKHWFDSEAFEEKYHTALPLGAFCGKEGTLCRLWAPTATAVTLNLYEAGIGGAALETVTMTSKEKGTWLWETERNLDGIYYDYLVTVAGVTRRTADPYAVACGVNGNRSMVLNLRRTDPENWKDDAAPAKTPENVICELHVKDFSWDPAGGFEAADRGKYTAFCRTGTTLNNDGVHPTGLDYLKNLGVTHIQLMPIYDYGSVDEAGPEDRYNWGYDPVNYNVPEGVYSSDPFRGEVRVRELKQAIQSLHANGFRVIMDVVYNHTYAQDSWLWRAAPWYYYRQKPNGDSSNGSGCGDDLATERSMCARYVLESVLYWAEEYHMDGFRFDLMGLLDVNLMNKIQAALDEKYGPGEKLIYGEPWRAGNTEIRPGTALADKDAMKMLDPRIGAFCDNTRDAVKGSHMNENDRGFVNGGGIHAARVRSCVTGWAEGQDAKIRSPYQTITYLSCHDDWTLWDKLVCSMDPEKRYTELQPDILRANRMAAAINFCCQGHVFFQTGEEFGRTKGGVKNSYHSDIQINMLDWNRAWENKDLVDYYRGLIALRKQLPALQDKTPLACRRVLFAADLSRDSVAVSLDNSGGSSRWKEVLMFFHANPAQRHTKLPEGSWELLVDGTSSFHWQKEQPCQKHITLEPSTVTIVGRIAD